MNLIYLIYAPGTNDQPLRPLFLDRDVAALHRPAARANPKRDIPSEEAGFSVHHGSADEAEDELLLRNQRREVPTLLQVRNSTAAHSSTRTKSSPSGTATQRKAPRTKPASTPSNPSSTTTYSSTTTPSTSSN